MKKRPDSELLQKKWRNNSSERDFFSKHFGLIHLAGLRVLKHFFCSNSPRFISLSLSSSCLFSSLLFPSLPFPSLLFSSLLFSSLLFSSLLFSSLLFSSLLWSLVSSLIFSSSLVSSFISDLLFFFSGLFFHLSSFIFLFLLFCCLVLSLFLCLSLSLSVSVSLSLSPCGGVWFVCCMLCVLVWLLLCVVCGGVWCVARLGTQKKPPCVDAKRPRVYRHHAHMCYHMCAWCRYTRGRFASTHGGFLDGHTEGRGVIVSAAKICPRVVITCIRGSPQETKGSYPFSV